MSLFQKIFSRKEPLVPFNLSFLGADIHSHLIPGIDDGAKTLEESIQLARGLVDLGYKRVFTTPHIMSDFYQNNPEIILNGLNQLNKALISENIVLKVEAAAEYYIDFEFIDRIGKEQLLTFGNNYILVECSFIEPPRAFFESIFKLQTNGYKPILAHPERYVYWHRDLNIYQELKDREILFQINILSLIGVYSPAAAEVAEYLLINKMVNWLGTDLHNQYQLAELKNLKLKQSIIDCINNTTFLNSTL